MKERFLIFYAKFNKNYNNGDDDYNNYFVAAFLCESFNDFRFDWYLCH